MPNEVLTIDGYQEREAGMWVNKKPLYQMDIKINAMTSSPSFYDTGDILDLLEVLTSIEGIAYSSYEAKYVTFTDQTYYYNATYDKDTKYLKIENNNGGSLSNITISLYYTKTNLQKNRDIQDPGSYYPVEDVKVNGISVVDTNRVAQIKSYKEITLAEYNALPPSKNSDGIMYCIIDGSGVDDKNILDVQLDGESVVDEYGIANLNGLAKAVDLLTKQNTLVAGDNITLTVLSDGTVRIDAAGSSAPAGNVVTNVLVNNQSVVTAGIANITIPAVPTQTSQLTNNSGFIDRTVNDLTNYYTKTETAEEIANAIPVKDVKVDNVSVVDINGIANISSGGGGGGSSTLAGLTDVDLITPTDGQVLIYDGTSREWKNANAPSGGGNVDDVVMNGQSIVDANKVANFNNYVELTRAEWEALPDSKYSDGILYCIKDSGSEKAEFFSPIIYSLAEREVGVWIDGRPLYERCFYSTNLTFTNTDYSTLVQLDSSIDVVTDISGYFKRNINNNTIMYMPLDSAYINNDYSNRFYDFCVRVSNNRIDYYNMNYGSQIVELLVKLRYTKTTDNPGTGKWTTSGVPAHHYSTEEQVIGTWIDGKPLYEKTLVRNNIKMGNHDGNRTTIAHGISNFGDIVSLQIACPKLGISAHDVLYSDSASVIAGFRVNATNIYCVAGNAYFDSTVDRYWYITLQYTKTTD